MPAEGKVEPRQVRIAMQHLVHVLVDVSAASRARSMRPLSTRMSRTETATTGGKRRCREVQQRQQLEAELPAPERIHLQQHDVGLGRIERIEQRLLALDLPALVDLVAVLVEQIGELRIRRDRRRQLHHARSRWRDASHRRAAQHEVDLSPAATNARAIAAARLRCPMPSRCCT
jgi:hypothetical protein